MALQALHSLGGLVKPRTGYRGWQGEAWVRDSSNGLLRTSNCKDPRGKSTVQKNANPRGLQIGQREVEKNQKDAIA